MKLKMITGSLLAGAALLLATAASANTLNLTGLNVNIGGGQEQYDEDNLRATLDCDVSCLGALNTAADGFVHDANVLYPTSSTATAPSSATTAELFELTNSAEATEIAAVNAITGESFTLADFSKDLSGDETFTTDAQYILIKIGADPNYALIENTGGLQEFTFDAIGQGAGLSHVSFFGGTTLVSEPGILALFGVGLTLLGFMRRRAIA